MTKEVSGRPVLRLGSIGKEASSQQAARRMGAGHAGPGASGVRSGTSAGGPPNLEVALAWARGFDSARRYVNRLYPKRGRMLEVGSGYGFLMAAFKADGWRVHGIDTDEASCRYARERNGVAAHAVPLGDAGIPNEAFDVVVFGRLLAAQSDLRQVLAQAARILRPGGHCLVDLPRGGLLMTLGIAGDDAVATGFRLVASPQLDPHAGNLLRQVSRRLLRPRKNRMVVSGPPEGWERVWLQRVAVVTSEAAANDAVPGTAGRSSLPAWLSSEVAGVVTLTAARDPLEPDIRRGYPWRVPDRLFARNAVVVTH